MRISEMLYAIASWLESPDNEVLLLAEYDNECLKVAVESCIEAAFILKNAAEKVDDIEPPEESNITAESLDGLAQIATAFDTSGNLDLKKQASVIDELLLTIASPPNIFAERKDLEDNRLEELKKRYQQPRKELEKINKIVDSVNAIEKSDFMKDRKIIETSLNTRTCPDHPGAQMARKDDCILKVENQLLKEELLTHESMAKIREEILGEIETAVNFARQSPFPDESELMDALYA